MCIVHHIITGRNLKSNNKQSTNDHTPKVCSDTHPNTSRPTAPRSARSNYASCFCALILPMLQEGWAARGVTSGLCAAAAPRTRCRCSARARADTLPLPLPPMLIFIAIPPLPLLLLMVEIQLFREHAPALVPTPRARGTSSCTRARGGAAP
ncbi:hypothetical protein FIBSPDRAFT_596830 [Athelia psychrophila]|uniref:Uncharacterized protein n=1 Tax=Athelia psychrophila TaxID=1759441 RepID=A0A166GWV4_9AGAM|nr:hypothetical protein FIBSPDRAFT_596830 [Fibularhizoctonia sp. CBS 109695]